MRSGTDAIGARGLSVERRHESTRLLAICFVTAMLECARTSVRLRFCAFRSSHLIQNSGIFMALFGFCGFVIFRRKNL